MSQFEDEVVVVFGGVDIGGSHVGVCLIDKSYTIIASTEENNTSEEIGDSGIMLNKIFRLLKRVQLKSGVETRLAGVGVGCPGQPKDGVLTAAANFPMWKNVPFVDEIKSKLNIPATLLNDVDAALTAEYWGQPAEYADVQHAVMVALGTGVGYSVVVDGKQHLGHHGLLEGGHMIINPASDLLCGCGQYGCIEVYTSAKNTALRYEKALYEAHPCSGNEERQEFNAQDVFRRAEEGDEIALRIIDEVTDYLAVFAINISRMLDPQVIIFAGGMANAGTFLLSRVQHHFSRRTWTVLPSKVRLKIAENCDSAGMLGAAVAASKLLEIEKEGEES